MAVLKLGPSASVVLAAGLNDNITPAPAIGTLNRLRVDTTAGAASGTGLAAGADGQLLWILNDGPNDFTLLNADTGSTGVNRFAGPADLTIPTKASMLIYYDAAVLTGRWVIGV